MDKRTDAKLNLEFLNNYLLEDEIYLRMDKLQALCYVQIVLNSSDNLTAPNIRTHYAMVLEDQVIELRNLLNQLFI